MAFKAHLPLFLTLLLSGHSAIAQKKKNADKKDIPKILYTIPLTAVPDSKQKLILRGKYLDGVKEVKITGDEGAKLKFLSAKKSPVGANLPGERVGDAEVEIELELPKNIRKGITLTAIGNDGESVAFPLLFRDDTPFAVEKEPNDGFEQAQLVAVPIAIGGTIKADRDVDVFKFEVKKGERLKIEVQAARFGSPLDAMITLYDTDRRTLAIVDDVEGSADPVLEFTPQRDGLVHLAIIDAHDLGGPQFGYRVVIKKAK